MISLSKVRKPDVLHQNEDKWTAQFISYQNGEDVPSTYGRKYGHEHIKRALERETCSKCAYCESKIKHISHGDIEHIEPKSEAPRKVVEWSNLTLACRICNQRKGTYHNRSDPLVNPYIDDPSDHIQATGAFIFPVPGDRKGKLSQVIFDLNRGGLTENRGERLKKIVPLVAEWAQETGELKEVLHNQLLKEIEQCREYVMTVRAYFRLNNVI